MKLPPENVGFAVKTRKDGAKPQTYKISSVAHGQRDHAHGLNFWKMHQIVWNKLGSVLQKLQKKSPPCAWSRDTMRMVTPKIEIGAAQLWELWELSGGFWKNSHHAHGLPHHAHGPPGFCLYKQQPPNSKIIPHNTPFMPKITSSLKNLTFSL